MAHVALPAEINRCIDTCASCHQVCVDTAAHCLEMGGEHATPEIVGVLADCEQICRTTQDFMVRSSMQHSSTCAACAEVCDACAAACDALADDPQMAACAQECRNCADACRRAGATPMTARVRTIAQRGRMRRSTRR